MPDIIPVILSGGAGTRLWPHGAQAFLIIAALLAAPVALFAPQGLTVLGLTVAVGVVAASRRERPWTRVPTALFGFIAIIILWALIGGFWALDPAQTITATLRLAVIAVVGALMLAALDNPSLSTRWVWPVLLVSLGIAALFLFWDYVGHRRPATTWHYHLRGFSGDPGGQKSVFTQFSTVLLLLMWPLALAVARRWGRWAGGGVVLTTAPILLVGDNMSARVGIILGLLALFAVWWRPSRALYAMRVIFLAVAVLLPVGMQFVPSPQETMQEWTWVPNSAHHRLTIWTFTSQRIIEKPIFGWGLDASRAIPGADEEVTVVRRIEGAMPFVLYEALLPLHPHNAILQLWLELGAVGVAIMIGLVWWGFRRIEAVSDPLARAVFAATLSTGLLVASVSYGFWQNWWQVTMWLIAGLCVAAARTRVCKG